MQQKKKVSLKPKLRFPEFQDTGEWTFIPLNKQAKRCIEKNKGSTITRVLTNSAEYGVVDQRDYFDKDIATQGNLENYYVIEKGDYVYNPRISTSAPVGPISKNNIATGVMSPLYTIFRFENDDNDFYMHYFKTAGWHNYMRQASSTGARHDRIAITNNDFMAMPLPASTLEEQKKIANCLTSLDELIAVETNRLNTFNTYKKGIVQQLFPLKNETLPTLRFPAFRNTSQWDPMKLWMVCDMQAGKFVAAENIDKEYRTSLFPCYGGNGLRGYTKTYTHSGCYALIGRQGALCGNVNLVNGVFHATEHAVVATPRAGVHTEWLFYALEQLNLNKFATGQAQPGLSVEVLNNVELRIPKDENEQKSIANILTSTDKLINIQTKKIAIIKTHKKGLMQQLFPNLGEI